MKDGEIKPVREKKEPEKPKTEVIRQSLGFQMNKPKKYEEEVPAL